MNKNSWEKVKPTLEVKERIWETTLAKSAKQTIPTWQKLMPIAACLVLLIAAAPVLAKMANNMANMIKEYTYTRSGMAIRLGKSTKGVRADYANGYFEHDAFGQSSSLLAHLTEDELLNVPDTNIFEGTIMDVYNLKITMSDNDIMYYGYARIRVDNVLRGELEPKIGSDEVIIMLHGPVVGKRGEEFHEILPDGGEVVGVKPIDVPWVEDTDITSQFGCSQWQKGIFMIGELDDSLDFRETDGEKFVYSDLADYKFFDGMRYAFIETTDGLQFARDSYPSISNATTLAEVKEFIVSKIK